MSPDEEEPTETDKERRLLNQLDAMPYNEWSAIVVWMAAKMAAENPTLLAEIVIQRGMKLADERAKQLRTEINVPEVIALEFSRVGLKLVPV